MSNVTGPSSPTLRAALWSAGALALAFMLTFFAILPTLDVKRLAEKAAEAQSTETLVGWIYVFSGLTFILSVALVIFLAVSAFLAHKELFEQRRALEALLRAQHDGEGTNDNSV